MKQRIAKTLIGVKAKHILSDTFVFNRKRHKPLLQRIQSDMPLLQLISVKADLLRFEHFPAT